MDYVGILHDFVWELFWGILLGPSWPWGLFALGPIGPSGLLARGPIGPRAYWPWGLLALDPIGPVPIGPGTGPKVISFSGMCSPVQVEPAT